MKILSIILLFSISAHAQFSAAGRGQANPKPLAAIQSSDTVVAKFNFNLTAQSVAGLTDVSGDPHASVRSATSTLNYQNVTVNSLSTSKWVGVGTFVAAVSSGGGFTESAVGSTAGASYWYNNNPANTWNGWVPGSENLRIGGLDPTKLYTIKTANALTTGAGGCPSYNMTEYCIDSTNSRVDSVGTGSPSATNFSYKANASTYVVFINRRPDASGYIYFGIYPRAGGTSANCGQFGILEAMIITKQGTRL